MRVEIGNDNAIEEYRDPTSDDPSLLRVRALEGERVTTLLYPEDYSIADAVSSTIDAMRHHLAPGGRPAWIESDVEPLRLSLCQEFGVSPEAKRPLTWGGQIDPPEPDPEPAPEAPTTEDDD